MATWLACQKAVPLSAISNFLNGDSHAATLICLFQYFVDIRV